MDPVPLAEAAWAAGRARHRVNRESSPPLAGTNCGRELKGWELKIENCRLEIENWREAGGGGRLWGRYLARDGAGLKFRCGFAGQVNEGFGFGAGFGLPDGAEKLVNRLTREGAGRAWQRRDGLAERIPLLKQ